MSATPSVPVAESRRRGWLSALAATVVLVGLALLGELFLRAFPPKDLQPFLGEQSPLTGVFVPDAEFGAAYRSWEAFRADNADRLAEYLPLDRTGESRPVWAMFGSS